MAYSSVTSLNDTTTPYGCLMIDMGESHPNCCNVSVLDSLNEICRLEGNAQDL